MNYHNFSVWFENKYINLFSICYNTVEMTIYALDKMYDGFGCYLFNALTRPIFELGICSLHKNGV